MKRVGKLKGEDKGFSLVELIVVIAIMVVLIAVLGSTILGYVERAKYAKDIMALDILETAASAYVGDLGAAYEDKTEYTLADLVSSTPNAALGKVMDPNNVFKTIVKEPFMWANDDVDFIAESDTFKGIKAADIKMYFDGGIVSIKVDSKNPNFQDYVAGTHYTAD